MDAHEGLRRGHWIGFIASSDHLATSCSYACVWSEKRDRESIFRAMQMRRTYGATDRIRLAVTAGDTFMGGRIRAAAMPEVQVEATGTDKISVVEFVLDGEVALTSEFDTVEVSTAFDAGPLETGLHYIYVHLVQADDNQAWSSPVFVEIE
jgi:hypothetical protein